MATKQAKEGFTHKGKTYKVLPLSLLRIDLDYQRRLNQSAVNINSSDEKYDERAMRCLTVSERRDGLFWIVDGQHRYEMAKLRNPDDEVVCEIHTGLSQVDEAGLFTTLNNQKTVNAGSKFRAGMVQRDPKCLEIKGIVTSEGFNICLEAGRPRTNNNLTNVSGIIKVFGWDQGHTLRNALRVLKGAYTITQDGRVEPTAVSDLFLQGFATYLFRHQDVDVSDVIRAMQGQDAWAFQLWVREEANGAARKDAVNTFVRLVASKVDGYLRRTRSAARTRR